MVRIPDYHYTELMIILWSTPKAADAAFSRGGYNATYVVVIDDPAGDDGRAPGARPSSMSYYNKIKHVQQKLNKLLLEQIHSTLIVIK
ncbi:hypothetical protein Dimus_021915 [Dionaea muscipula]